MLNKGDKVVIYAKKAHRESADRVLRIATITHISRYRAHYDGAFGSKGGIPRNQPPATAEEVAAAEADLQKQTAAVRAKRAEVDADKVRRAADPRLSAIDYLRSRCIEQEIERLTTEQLTTIRRWIEELD